MSQNPFFSILIPSYNRPEYIGLCIDSILNNNFKNFEIIISDDNSPKSKQIEEVIKPYLRENEKISFYVQNINLSEPSNKNYLVNKATGLYNIFLGDDDMFFPNTLTRIKKYIDNYPGYDIYTLGYSIIDENDKIYYSRNSPKILNIDLSKIDLVKELFISDIFPFWFYHPATFCSRKGLELDTPYSTQAGIGEDFQFIFNVLNKNKKIFIIPEVLLKWRKIQKDSSSAQINQSYYSINNIIARHNIYINYLTKMNEVHLSIRNFFNSYEFRKRFLYDPIIFDFSNLKGNINKLNLKEAYTKELNFLLNGKNLLVFRLLQYCKRTYNYYKIFGIKGFAQVAKIFFQRIKYKII